MKWRNSRRSNNIDDLRGQPSRKRHGGIKIGGVGIIIIFIVSLIFGQDPILLLSMITGSESQSPTQQTPHQSTKKDDTYDFVSTVLASNEDMWNKHLPQQAGVPYVEPRLEVFTRSVRSACGMASAASGSFYCPADKQVYIDLAFFHELKKMGAAATSHRPMLSGMKLDTMCKTS